MLPACYKILPYLIFITFWIFQSVRSDSPSVRVLHSNEVTPHEIPYQVCLRNVSTSTNPASCECSGALLSPYYVLTVSACASFTHAVVGVHDATFAGAYEQRREIVLRSTSPLPNNDVTLLELSDEINFNTFVDAVSLVPSPPQPMTTAFVSGWGAIEDDPEQSFSPKLRRASVTIVNETVCNSTSHWNSTITPGTKVCAWIPETTAPPEDAMAVISAGDLGNPLTCTQGVGAMAKNYLCGLALRSGRRVPEDDRPDIYASVAYHSAWISDTIKKDIPCEVLGQGTFASLYTGKYFRCEFGPTGWLKYVFRCPTGQTYYEGQKACGVITTTAAPTLV